MSFNSVNQKPHCCKNRDSISSHARTIRASSMAQQQSHAAETVRRRLNMAHLPLSFAGGCQHGSLCERPRILSIKMTLLLGDASLFLSTLLSKIFRDAFAPYLSKYSRRCAAPRSRLISSHSRASDAVPKRIIYMRSPSDLDIVAV